MSKDEEKDLFDRLEENINNEDNASDGGLGGIPSEESIVNESWIGEKQKDYDNLRKGAEVPPRPTKENSDKEE